MTGRIVVIAAHPDDEVLGCGGTIVKHVEKGDEVCVIFMADGETSRDKDCWDMPARNRNIKAAKNTLGIKEVFPLGYPDQRMDTLPFLDIVKSLEKILRRVAPDTIYTHHGEDLNLDHRLTHQATMTACRPLPESGLNAIYTFEVVSSTGWASSSASQFRPLRVSNITDQLDRKIEALKCYEQEMRGFPHARSVESVIHLAKYRGAQFGVDAAEAFGVERIIWR